MPAFKLIQHHGVNGESIDTWLVLGEVVGVHISKDLLKDDVYGAAAARPNLRGGGPADYFEISPDLKFKIFWPRG